MKESIKQFNSLFAKYFPDLKIKEYYYCRRGVSFYSQILIRFFIIDRICKRLDVFETEYENEMLYRHLEEVNFTYEEKNDHERFEEVLMEYLVQFNNESIKKEFSNQIRLYSNFLGENSLHRFIFYRSVIWEIYSEIININVKTDDGFISDLSNVILSLCDYENIKFNPYSFVKNKIPRPAEFWISTDYDIVLFKNLKKIKDNIKPLSFVSFYSDEYYDRTIWADDIVINPQPKDLGRGEEKYIIFIDSKVDITNGELIGEREGIKVFSLTDVPEFVYANNTNYNDYLDEAVDIQFSTGEIKEKPFNSLLPVDKKYIALYMLSDKLKNKIAGNYIVGGSKKFTDFEYIGDNKFKSVESGRPYINYVNKIEKGNLY